MQLALASLQSLLSLLFHHLPHCRARYTAAAVVRLARMRSLRPSELNAPAVHALPTQTYLDHLTLARRFRVNLALPDRTRRLHRSALSVLSAHARLTQRRHPNVLQTAVLSAPEDKRRP